MRVLLRDRESKMYYQGANSWTANPVQAFDFQCSAGLPEYQEVLSLSTAELVVMPPHARSTACSQAGTLATQTLSSH